MSQLSNIKNVKEILARHGFTFSKKLGQNFIVNPSICPRIAELGGAGPDTGVLEIGPGLGVLTWELAARARKVVAVELDERLLPVLGETLAGFDNIKVIQADVLKIDLDALLRQEFPNMEVVICANLPYYITSPIVMRLLETRLPVKAITVMVQKEAAARICAAPGQPQCRRTQRSSQLLCSSSNSVSGLPRQFYACAGGGFGCDSAGYSAAARRIPRGRSAVFQGDPGRIFPAAENAVQFSFFRIGPCQGSDLGCIAAGGPSPIRSGGGIDAGRFLPADVANF